MASISPKSRIRRSSERRASLPAAQEAIGPGDRARRAARDFVGLLRRRDDLPRLRQLARAAQLARGRHFNFDWSLHLEGDKAVKNGYAGFDWEREPSLDARLEEAAAQLELLGAPRRTIAPGEYRAYLSPRALEELVGLLAWGGFSARARATKQSPLLRMEHGRKADVRKLTPGREHRRRHRAGVPGRRLRQAAARDADRERRSCATRSYRRARRRNTGSSRTARPRESRSRSRCSPARCPPGRRSLRSMNGLYISNLWYLNYSDRPAGRITGMTRFATFWVEGGRIVAPATPLRFDDTIYRMLGDEARRSHARARAGCSTRRPTTSARLRARGCPARCCPR